MCNLVKRVFEDDNFVKSDGIYLYTDDNKEIIDGCSNSMNVNLGYGVLEIEKVIQEQIRKINFMHTGKGTTYESLMLANRLHDIIKPYGNYKVYFATSGSDCIEAALRISVLYQQKNKRNQGSNTRFATFEGSYHGSTLGALSVSGHRKFQKLYNGYIGDCLTIPTRWNLEWEMDFTDITAFVLDSMITNPIGSEMIDRDYLNYLVEICKESGVITIIDEIATSIGRLGCFFGFEDSGISPDIVCISKGLGVGYANIGAVIVKSNIIDSINSADILGHTYNASPIDCKIAMTVLDYIEEHGIFEHVNNLSNYIEYRLKDLKNKLPCISKVSGKGFMWSIHFRNNVNASKLFKECYNNGLLLLYLEYEAYNHMTFCPPLITSKNQIDSMLDILEKSITKVLHGH